MCSIKQRKICERMMSVKIKYKRKTKSTSEISEYKLLSKRASAKNKTKPKVYGV